MLKLLFFFILGWWGLSFSATINPIGILPPEVIPEREYGYLQRPIYQYILNQLNISAEIPFVPVTLSNREKFSKLLESKIRFISSERVLIELNLQDLQTGRSYWSSLKEVSTDLFWTTLGQELEILRKTLSPRVPTLDKPQEVPFKRVSSPPKVKEEKSSWFTRLNPFHLISGLLPKKEDPLKIKVRVPPPPPPPGYNLKDSLPQISPVPVSPVQVTPQQPTPHQREGISSVERSQNIPTKEASPWQWW